MVERLALETTCSRFLQPVNFCLHKKTNYSAVEFKDESLQKCHNLGELIGTEIAILQRSNSAPFSKTNLVTQAHIFASTPTQRINLFLCLPTESAFFFFFFFLFCFVLLGFFPPKKNH